MPPRETALEFLDAFYGRGRWQESDVRFDSCRNHWLQKLVETWVPLFLAKVLIATLLFVLGFCSPHNTTTALSSFFWTTCHFVAAVRGP